MLIGFQIFAWVVALAAGTITATVNFRYGLMAGTGVEKYIYAVGATVVDVAKTFLPAMIALCLKGTFESGTFSRRLAAAIFWFIGVALSLFTAAGLYALQLDAGAADLAGGKAAYEKLVSDKATKEKTLAALGSVRLAETVQGEIDVLKRNKAWTRTEECTQATRGDSRTFCAKVDALKAEHLTSRKSSDVAVETEKLKGEIADIEKRLTGIDMAALFKTANAQLAPIAKQLSVDERVIGAAFALLLGCLFEMCSLLPWIVTGSHAGTATVSKSEKAQPAKKAASQSQAEPVQQIGNDAFDRWSTESLQRTRGASASAKEVYEAYVAWTRTQGEETLNKTAFGKAMRVAGFQGRKVSGVQRYWNVAAAARSGPVLAVSNV